MVSEVSSLSIQASLSILWRNFHCPIHTNWTQPDSFRDFQRQDTEVFRTKIVSDINIGDIVYFSKEKHAAPFKVVELSRDQRKGGIEIIGRSIKRGSRLVRYADMDEKLDTISDREKLTWYDLVRPSSYVLHWYSDYTSKGELTFLKKSLDNREMILCKKGDPETEWAMDVPDIATLNTFYNEMQKGHQIRKYLLQQQFRDCRLIP